MNVDVDDELVARVMSRYGLRSKREAVEFALRAVAGERRHRDVLALEGIGWEGDLDEMREHDSPPEPPPFEPDEELITDLERGQGSGRDKHR